MKLVKSSQIRILDYFVSNKEYIITEVTALTKSRNQQYSIKKLNMKTFEDSSFTIRTWKLKEGYEKELNKDFCLQQMYIIELQNIVGRDVKTVAEIVCFTSKSTNTKSQRKQET